MIRRGLPAAALLLLAACSNAAGGPSGDAYAKGVAALEAGQPRLARIELLNAIQADPNDRRARIAQARTYLALGDGVAAEAELDRARKLGEPADATRHLMAHAWLLENRLDDALREAARAPADHAAYAARIRGLALMRQGDVDGASAAFAQAIEGAPRDAATWADLARFRRSTGDLAGAVAAADKAIALGGTDARALMLRGELARSHEGLAAALPWFDRAAAIDASDPNIVLERAATLGELGRASEMLAATRKALALSPDHPTAYFMQAVLAARARNFELARSLLDRAGDIVDTLPAAMLLRGALDYQAGDDERAIDRLGQLVERQPDNVKARRLLAAAQVRAGHKDAAAATLRPLIGRDGYAQHLVQAQQGRPGETLAPGDASGGSPDIVHLRSLLAAGRPGDAQGLARRLAADHPGTPDTQVALGDTLAAGGDFAGAAEAYRRAAAIAFTEPVVLRLIEALERTGRGDQAARLLDRFLAQNPANVPARLLAARRLLAGKRWDEAIAVYEGLRRRLGDRDAALLNNLAWAYAEKGDFARALPLARKAWSLDQTNPATADTLGWILLQSGQHKAESLALLLRAKRG